MMPWPLRGCFEMKTVQLLRDGPKQHGGKSSEMSKENIQRDVQIIIGCAHLIAKVPT